MTTNANSTSAATSRSRLPRYAALATIGGALLISACGDVEFEFDVVGGEDGSGTVTTRTYDLEEITAIDVGAVFDVDVQVEAGAEQLIEIRTDDNLFDNLDVEVIDGELILDTTDGVSPSDGLKVVIVTDELAKIHADGAASVSIDGEGGDVVIEASGATSIDASSFDADDVAVTADGASSVSVSARGDVTGSASGASSIDIESDGMVAVETSGAASVES